MCWIVNLLSSSLLTEKSYIFLRAVGLKIPLSKEGFLNDSGWAGLSIFGLTQPFDKQNFKFLDVKVKKD